MVTARENLWLIDANILIARQDIFDATLVAVMLDNNVTKIYSENVTDFNKFMAEGLTVVNPVA